MWRFLSLPASRCWVWDFLRCCFVSANTSTPYRALDLRKRDFGAKRNKKAQNSKIAINAATNVFVQKHFTNGVPVVLSPGEHNLLRISSAKSLLEVTSGATVLELKCRYPRWRHAMAGFMRKATRRTTSHPEHALSMGRRRPVLQLIHFRREFHNCSRPDHGNGLELVPRPLNSSCIDSKENTQTTQLARACPKSGLPVRTRFS
jgi:hypothetical protein